MVAIFLENLFSSYELGWIGRASTNILKVVWGSCAHHGPGGHQWQKVAKKQKSKRNEIELRSFHQSIRLDELIILVGSNVQIGCKMTKLWPSQDWPKVAARLILSHFLAILAIFLEIQSSNLFCPSFLSRVMGKPIFRPIGLKIAILSQKNLHLGHFLAIISKPNFPKVTLTRKSKTCSYFNIF